MKKKPVFLLLFLCTFTYTAGAQVADSTISSVEKIPANYYSRANKKISGVNNKLTKKSLKYLAKFQRQEKKMQEKLAKLNPGSAGTALTDATKKYTDLEQKIKSKTGAANKLLSGSYIPNLDSLGTSLSFLQQFNSLGDKVKAPMKSFGELQGKLQQASDIKDFIAQRKSQIKEILSRYAHLPPGLKSQYDKLNKTGYYYSAQVKEYKDMLKDPDKAEQKALSVLNKMPAFQKFMSQNGQLASLFRVPANYGSAQNLTGMQTRSTIQALVQQRIAAGGPNAQSQIQTNLAAAHAELDKVKDKITKYGEGGADVDMNKFKPNSQKTKPLLKRLEYGFNVQFAKSNSFLPSTSNVALSLGYKLNDNNSLGVGIGYNVGMGTIKHISITSQGLGLRSYADCRIKKQFYASGGYEMNYYSAFKNIEQLQNYNAWQRSGLVGLTKKYQVGKKKGEIKILYDFLANSHLPVSSPIIFRTGYSF